MLRLPEKTLDYSRYCKMADWRSLLGNQETLWLANRELGNRRQTAKIAPALLVGAILLLPDMIKLAPLLP